MAAIDDVAAAILARTGEVTTWKFQKLAYYAQAWHLVNVGEKLFADDFEAWEHGPVAPTLYHEHRRRNRVSHWPNGDAERLSPSESALVDWVVQQYGSFTAETLSRMSHIEAPWFVARQGLPSGARSTTVIDPDMMRTFYSRQLADPEDAVALAAANSFLEGVELDEEWQDSLRQVAEGTASADDLIQAEVRRIRGL